MNGVFNHFINSFNNGLYGFLRFMLMISSLYLLTCTNRSENEKFCQLADRFVEKYFESRPSIATTYGVHDFDDRLDDISTSSYQYQCELLDSTFHELMQIDKSKLSPENSAEFSLLANYLSAQRIDFVQLKQWERDPVSFIEHLGNSLYWLVNYRNADWGFRLQNILKRLIQIPRYLEQVKEYVVAPTKAHVDIAIEQTQGLIDFAQNQLPESFVQVPALEDSLNQVNREAIRALEAFLDYLKQDLSQHTSEHFRLGEGMFLKKLHVYCDSQTAPEEIIGLANTALDEVQSEMILVAEEVRKRYFPRKRYATERNDYHQRLLEDALEFTMKQRLSPEEMLVFLDDEFNNATRFVRLKELARFQPDAPVRFDLLPYFMQGYAPAKAFLPNLRRDKRTPIGEFNFFVYDGFAGWRWYEQLNYSKAFNKDMLRVYVLSYIMPGTYLQYKVGGGCSSPIQHLFGDPVTKGGWQVFAPLIMRKAGYTGYEPGFMLMQLKYTLNCILDAIIDVKVHTGDLSEKEARRVLAETGFMTPPEANLHWRKICIEPAKSVLQFIGFIELAKLRDERRIETGNYFSQKQFNDQILRCGFKPISAIRKQLSQK
ncbi:DUF885 family protein [candidate division KSB1 bacterium]|nr:DUF885 family protein [candidate division KSB1 bacterium]